MINATAPDKRQYGSGSGLLPHMGLPMWYLPDWRGGLLGADAQSGTALWDYSQVFDSVEGNTTFYGLPDASRLSNWWQQVPDDFRFCFKLPRDITHVGDPVAAIQSLAGKEFEDFLRAIADLGGHKLGVLMVQLPERVAVTSEDMLWRLFDAVLSMTEHCLGSRWSGSLAVECRHRSFFMKDEAETDFLRGLADRKMDRVIFDSRGLQMDRTKTEPVLDAQRKKPNMPVHAVATGRHPVVRFIGHSDWQQNIQGLQQWHRKLTQWQQEGRQPFVFWHTVGNQDVPGFHRWIMETFWQREVVWPGENAAGQTLELW